ncbi:MAG: hypothetical protein K8H85_14795 [Cyclobacteriaceae bacterium]|nr:hypothetical protein [Cyclobacteriaceae bacterium]
MTREKLTIGLFGKTKFWAGLSLGLTTTLILYFLFTYGREILRSTTAYSGDLLIPTKAEFVAYNLFFSAISITTGFGITAWFWFHNPFSFRHSYSFNQFIRTSLITGTLILLAALMKTSNIALFLLYGIDGYDNHLSFYYEIPELLVLFPTFFFLNIWTPIRIKYRVGNWFWYSIIAYCTGIVVLGFSTPIDQSRLNENWDKRNVPYHQIVDSEVVRARSNGINIDPKTIEILRFRGKQRVIDQAKLLKRSFKSKNIVPLELVVVELILIKKSNLKYIPNTDRGDLESMWPFVLPRDVYKQVTLSTDSVRTQYLIEILTEFKDIFTEQEMEPWELGEKDGLYEKYQNRFSMKWRYEDISLETNKYMDSLKVRE